MANRCEYPCTALLCYGVSAAFISSRMGAGLGGFIFVFGFYVLPFSLCWYLPRWIIRRDRHEQNRLVDRCSVLFHTAIASLQKGDDATARQCLQRINRLEHRWWFGESDIAGLTLFIWCLAAATGAFFITRFGASVLIDMVHHKQSLAPSVRHNLADWQSLLISFVAPLLALKSVFFAGDADPNSPSVFDYTTGDCFSDRLWEAFPDRLKADTSRHRPKTHPRAERMKEERRRGLETVEAVQRIRREAEELRRQEELWRQAEAERQREEQRRQKEERYQHTQEKSGNSNEQSWERAKRRAQPLLSPEKVLGVHTGASQAEITQAYRRLARMFHPDAHMNANPKKRAVNEEKMKAINAAYDALKRRSR